MRLAAAGQDGAGKTTICATAARLLAGAGNRVADRLVPLGRSEEVGR